MDYGQNAECSLNETRVYNYNELNNLTSIKTYPSYVVSGTPLREKKLIYDDAWGTILHQTGGVLAELNPYRYRGYRYDSETEWYYLQSRYYDPSIGRFINSDGLVGEVGNLISHNMYAYGVNNPVMNVDPSGESVVGLLIFSLIMYGVAEVGITVIELILQDYMIDNIPSVRLPIIIDVDNDVMVRIYYDQMARRYVERRDVNAGAMWEVLKLGISICLSDLPIIGDIGATVFGVWIDESKEAIFTNPFAMREEYRLAAYGVIGSGDYYDYYQERIYHWRDVYDLRQN